MWTIIELMAFEMSKLTQSPLEAELKERLRRKSLAKSRGQPYLVVPHTVHIPAYLQQAIPLLTPYVAKGESSHSAQPWTRVPNLHRNAKESCSLVWQSEHILNHSGGTPSQGLVGKTVGVCLASIHFQNASCPQFQWLVPILSPTVITHVSGSISVSSSWHP